MIDEATVDCYHESEAFAGMLATLDDRLAFPFQAKVLGETVEVIGLDEDQSSERRWVVAKVRKRGRHYTMVLADVEVVQKDKDTETAEWQGCRYHRPDGTDMLGRLQMTRKLIHTHTVSHAPNRSPPPGNSLYRRMLGGKSNIRGENSACAPL